jgi:hypothetical protein
MQWIVYFNKEKHGELGDSWHKLYRMHLPVPKLDMKLLCIYLFWVMMFASFYNLFYWTLKQFQQCNVYVFYLILLRLIMKGKRLQLSSKALAYNSMCSIAMTKHSHLELYAYYI